MSAHIVHECGLREEHDGSNVFEAILDHEDWCGFCGDGTTPLDAKIQSDWDKKIDEVLKEFQS